MTNDDDDPMSEEREIVLVHSPVSMAAALGIAVLGTAPFLALSGSWWVVALAADSCLSALFLREWMRRGTVRAHIRVSCAGVTWQERSRERRVDYGEVLSVTAYDGMEGDSLNFFMRNGSKTAINWGDMDSESFPKLCEYVRQSFPGPFIDRKHPDRSR